MSAVTQYVDGDYGPLIWVVRVMMQSNRAWRRGGKVVSGLWCVGVVPCAVCGVDSLSKPDVGGAWGAVLCRERRRCAPRKR